MNEIRYNVVVVNVEGLDFHRSLRIIHYKDKRQLEVDIKSFQIVIEQEHLTAIDNKVTKTISGSNKLTDHHPHKT